MGLASATAAHRATLPTGLKEPAPPALPELPPRPENTPIDGRELGREVVRKAAPLAAMLVAGKLMAGPGTALAARLGGHGQFWARAARFALQGFAAGAAFGATESLFLREAGEDKQTTLSRIAMGTAFGAAVFSVAVGLAGAALLKRKVPWLLD